MLYSGAGGVHYETQIFSLDDRSAHPFLHSSGLRTEGVGGSSLSADICCRGAVHHCLRFHAAHFGFGFKTCRKMKKARTFTFGLFFVF